MTFRGPSFFGAFLVACSLALTFPSCGPCKNSICRSRELDTTISEGEAFGFKIGESKEEVFRRAKNMFSRGSIRWVAPHIDVESLTNIYGANVFELQDIEKVEDAFSAWSWWQIHNWSAVTGAYISIKFDFDRPVIEMIIQQSSLSSPTVPAPSYRCNRWPSNASSSNQLREGLSYDEVYRIIKRLKKQDQYRNVKVRTSQGARRKVSHFTESDLERLKKWGTWDVQIKSIEYSPDFTRLSFEKDKLAKIYRLRKYNPYPF